eukprot:jgi/Botrbrau1/4885/Bobra.0032s0040.1
MPSSQRRTSVLTVRRTPMIMRSILIKSFSNFSPKSHTRAWGKCAHPRFHMRTTRWGQHMLKRAEEGSQLRPNNQGYHIAVVLRTTPPTFSLVDDQMFHPHLPLKN